MEAPTPRPVILLIDDEAAIADAVVYALETEGFAPHWRPTMTEGLAAFRALQPQLVVLDIGLPDGNGFELFQALRAEAKAKVPVIFLTARSGEIDRVVGLEMGADDYVTKPFSPRELTARVRAVLRRSANDGEPRRAEVGASGPPPEPVGFSLAAERCEIAFRGQPLTLTRYEYRLLKVFIEHPGRVFSREALLAKAWDHPEHSLDRTVDTHIKTLRAKLRAIDPNVNPIKTRRGLGYVLDDVEA